MTGTTTYRIIYATTARKSLKRLPAKDAQALVAKIAAIATDPFAPRPYVKKMQGTEGYRVRQGDWRAIYVIEQTVRVLTVERIGHRKKVYR